MKFIKFKSSLKNKSIVLEILSGPMGFVVTDYRSVNKCEGQVKVNLALVLDNGKKKIVPNCRVEFDTLEDEDDGAQRIVRLRK